MLIFSKMVSLEMEVLHYLISLLGIVKDEEEDAGIAVCLCVCVRQRFSSGLGPFSGSLVKPRLG